MAFQLRHWAGTAAVACALIAIAYLPPRPGEVRPDWFTVAEVHRGVLNGAIRSTGEAISLLAAREAATARAAAVRPGAATALLLPDASLSAADERTLAALVNDAASTLGSTTSGIRVAVALSREAIPNPTGGRLDPTIGIGGSSVVLPTPANHTCLVLIPDVERPHSGYARPQLRAFGLGVCAFYAAFGAPGPKIERWLRTIGFRPALSGVWASSHGERQIAGFGPDTGHRWPFVGIEPAYDVSLDVAACAGGDRAACAWGLDSLREPTVPGLPDFVWQPSFIWWGRGGGSTLFGDLIAQRGREAFRKFWTSPLEPDSAFTAAMGEHLVDWAHRWTVQHVGPTPTTPRPRLPSSLFSMLTIALAVAASVVFAGRRTVR